MHPMLDFTLIFQDECLHDKVKFLYWRRKIIYCGREKTRDGARVSMHM